MNWFGLGTSHGEGGDAGDDNKGGDSGDDNKGDDSGDDNNKGDDDSCEC